MSEQFIETESNSNDNDDSQQKNTFTGGSVTTTRQQLKKQTSYTPGIQISGNSLTSSTINRNCSLDIIEEPINESHSNYLSAHSNQKHSNSLANNYNLSYESKMSLAHTTVRDDAINNEFSLHRSNEYENLTDGLSNEDYDKFTLNNKSQLKRTNELEDLSEII